jgi:hypothetical protein
MVIETHLNITNDLKARLGLKSIHDYNMDLEAVQLNIKSGKIHPDYGGVASELVKISGVIPYGTCEDGKGISVQYTGRSKQFGQILDEIAKNYNMEARPHKNRYVIRPPKCGCDG